ncbi:MAG: transcription termination factor NusA [Oscillospiraceae bacterium]
MNEAFFEALNSLEKENGISGNLMVEKIEQGILRAIKKEYPDCDNVHVDIDKKTGNFNMYLLKDVVDGEAEDGNQINIDEAKAIDKKSRVGGTCEIKLSPAIFGRVAASAAKQSIRHDIKEFEREQLLDQFHDKEHEVITATVTKIDPLSGVITLALDKKTEILLFKNEQIPGEVLKEGDIVKVYVVAIINPDKKPAIKISRTHKDLVKRLFEIEIPEIYDGVVEVKEISREAGSRSKVAVCSKDPNVDAVGACIGPKRSRITKIVQELGGEKIDIIPYSEESDKFIAKALAPADVISVTIDDAEARTCTVVVPNNQLSLAIGNKGQNAKLAARLTKFKIDIKPETEVAEQ